MLGYISSTRKKSCYACVKAKRRCDLGYPFCKRCGIKGYDCKYPNATPRDNFKASSHVPAEVVVRQTTPDLVPLASVDLFDPFFFQTSDSSGSTSSSSSEALDDFQLQDGWIIENPRPMPRTPLTRMLVPEIAVPSFLSEAQTLFVIRSLISLVPAMAFNGTTTFLHRHLYQTHEPQAYQDCVALSALYLSKTARTESILVKSMTAKISSMINEAPTWTLPQHLAAVQALIIYQIIRLYDPTLNLHAEAVAHNTLLQHWSAQLWKRAFDEPQPFESDYASWVFHESLRRTIMTSVFVRCGWSCLTRGGYAEQVPVLARLPVTKDLEAWDCAREEWDVRSLSILGEEENLMTYGDMGGSWSHDRSVEGMDPFAKMLLAACRGEDDPRLLV
ncbi:hypothetical protein BDU57DRAFT_327194 [Ampelomyces quisqualis]|uniref:Zn(2)-C6 fungal-type domain-containing protein n=1 Tax=Ampelomyces quisqualis TaxID=50730 RepID=A0A6A5QEV9_AMPQU|nr:hypothetical protein BDU57DRAFT_327194 [Ampelomyces quisqualis]